MTTRGKKIMIDFIELLIDAIEIADETPFLAKYSPNFFAEKLIPLNPVNGPAFTAGSAMASELPNLKRKLKHH
jgi:hypothetical protein